MAELECNTLLRESSSIKGQCVDISPSLTLSPSHHNPPNIYVNIILLLKWLSKHPTIESEEEKQLQDSDQEISRLKEELQAKQEELTSLRSQREKEMLGQKGIQNQTAWYAHNYSDE